MMDKKIRRLIDDIFSDMKMTADNLALRDEMMANAQARYEDSVRQGKTEEEAFAEVAASLGDVQSLLKEMNAQDGGEQDVPNAPEEPKAEETEEPKDAEANTEKKAQDVPDLGEALGKAFGALGDMGKQIMPQAQKLVKQVDGMTGGVIGGIGKVVGKGLSDAQKAAGKAIDKLSGDKGEIVIDLGKIVVEPDEKKESPKAPAALRKRAQDIRAEAEIKQAAGDQEGARQLRAKAYAMENEADEMEKKLADIAAKEAEEAEATKETEEAAEVKKPEEKGTDFDSLMDEMAAVTKELNEMGKKTRSDRRRRRRGYRSGRGCPRRGRSRTRCRPSGRGEKNDCPPDGGSARYGHRSAFSGGGSARNQHQARCRRRDHQGFRRTGCRGQVGSRGRRRDSAEYGL